MGKKFIVLALVPALLLFPVAACADTGGAAVQGQVLNQLLSEAAQMIDAGQFPQAAAVLQQMLEVENSMPRNSSAALDAPIINDETAQLQAELYQDVVGGQTQDLVNALNQMQNNEITAELMGATGND